MAPEITEAVIPRSYPTTALQQGMLYHALSYPNQGVDIEQILCTFHEPLRLEHFHSAWQKLSVRHEILRTAFEWQNRAEPLQRVAPSTQIASVHFDWRCHSETEQQTKLDAYLHEDRHRDFDMDQPPLMRLAVFETAETNFHWLWTFHHALLDGRSFPIVLNEFVTLYDVVSLDCSTSNDGNLARVALPPVTPFGEYAKWLQQQDFRESQGYWEELLAGFYAPTPLDFGTPTSNSAGQGIVESQLSADHAKALRDYAVKHEATLNTLVQAAWGLLLHHYTQEDDIVIGNTRACRHGTPFADAQEMIGLFINTVPLRLAIDENETFVSYLQKLRTQHLALRPHERVPLPQIQRWSDLEKGQPLFESLVVFENYLLNTTMQRSNHSPYERTFDYHGQTNFPLTLIGYADDALYLRLEYSKARFEDQIAQTLLTHLANLLSNLLEADELTPALAISYIAPSEVNHLLHKWNPTRQFNEQAPDAEYSPLHQRFEAQVRATPNAIAATFEAEQLTYFELNHLADRLAAQLWDEGAQIESFVGLCVERSLDIVIGILGILKAGGVYVPLDPASPADRLSFIGEDANLQLVVAHQETLDQATAMRRKVINLDTLRSLSTGEDPAAATNQTGLYRSSVAVEKDNLAYVIYTSGSTGKPKGVLVSHGNVTRLFDSTDHWFGFNQHDVWTLFHSFAFDFSVWELWGALLYGGRVVVVPYWISRSPEQFYQLVVDEGVTILNQTPSAFRQFIQVDKANAPATTNNHSETPHFALRKIIFGGEALQLSSLRPWVERYGDHKPHLVNMYGITETTVHVTYRLITQADIDANQGSVIGEPIPDLAIYILDKQRRPVPVGVVGEIFVGGAGVARGYHNRESLTTERFIGGSSLAIFDEEADGSPSLANGSLRKAHVESSSVVNPKLYKSGDLARRLPNGDIEYIGRSDFQVKIRGFRVELGEIEAVIHQYPQVQDAVVLAPLLETGSVQLVAYIIPEDDLIVEDLRAFVGARLPAYMVPSFFLSLDRFPLTNNGKLNTHQLPKPEVSRDILESSYIAPENDVEQTLVSIWQSVLRVDEVGIQDNFFELGGDSILSIQIISKAREAGLLLTPHQIFQHTTIAELAAVAEQVIQTKQNQGLVTGETPLTPIQHWFFEQDFPDKNQWNQSFLVEVAHPLDGPTLEKSLVELHRHHDMLRARYDFTMSDGSHKSGAEANLPLRGWHQTIMAEPLDEPYVQWVDLRGRSADEQLIQINRMASEAQRQLDIQRGKLVQVVYFQLSSSEDDEPIKDRLLIAIHHLVVDGVSWRILFKDLNRIYTALAADDASPLVTKSSSFQEWGHTLVDYAQEFAKDNARQYEITYWQNQLNRLLTFLPTDKPKGENVEDSVDEVISRFDVEVTSKLLRDVPSAYNTQINDLLLTALTLAHYRWTGSHALLLELEGHGREDAAIGGGLDLSDTVGWFTTVFPVYFDVSCARSGSQIDFGEALIQVKESLRAVPQKGIGYGILRYLTKESLTVPATFRPGIVFNYLGQLDQLTADTPLFDLVAEPVVHVHSPTAVRRHLLEILGQIVDGALEIRWLYSQNIHNRSTIERFAGYFDDALHAVVEHCIAQTQSRYSPSDYPLASLTQRALDRLQQSAQAQNLQIDAIYPLSPMQQLFYTMDAINPALGFEQWHFAISGPLDKGALREAWHQVVTRHSILRTAFVDTALNQPHQIVFKHVALPWQELDISTLPSDKQAQQISLLLQKDRENPFDLTEAPLNRLYLLQLNRQAFQLIWSTHHLEIDGWSWPLIFNDLNAIYTDIIEGKSATANLTPAPQYQTYLRWFQSQDPTESANFWREILAGFTQPTALAGMATQSTGKSQNLAKPESSQGDQEIRSVTYPDPIEATGTLESQLLDALTNLAQHHRVTLGNLFQAAWGMLLSATSGNQDVLWGTTFAGRPTDLPNAGEIVGPFVNNLPVRASVDDASTLGEWLVDLQQNQLALTQHQHTPLAQIQQWSDVPIRHRLFNSLVVFQNYRVDESARTLAGNVTLETLADPQATNYPLTIVGIPHKELTLKVICRPEYFQPQVADDILHDFQQILKAIANQGNDSISNYFHDVQRWSQHEAIADSFSYENDQPKKSANQRASQADAPSIHRHSIGRVKPKPPTTVGSNAMEEAVSEIWRSLFEREEISLYDNFFDLGGHSLMIASMHEALQAKLGRTFPITQVFQHPTIQSLAASLSQNGFAPHNNYSNIRNRAERSRAARQERRR